MKDKILKIYNWIGFISFVVGLNMIFRGIQSDGREYLVTGLIIFVVDILVLIFRNRIFSNKVINNEKNN